MRQLDVRRPTALFSLLVWLGASGTGRAAEQENLNFQAFCGGMDAAEISFVAEQQGGRFHGHLSIRTRGVTRWVSKLSIDSDSWGEVTPEGFRPTTFNQFTSSKEKSRHTEMRFVDQGRVAETLLDEERRADSSLVPPDADDPDPVVPDEARRQVLDPVTALFEMGRRSMAGEGHFVLAVFDGRRRYDLVVEAVGPGRHDIGGRDYDTLDLKAVMKPLYGFRPRYMDFWRDAGFDVFVSRDIGLPVKIMTTTFTAGTVIGLQTVCRGSQPCPPS